MPRPSSSISDPEADTSGYRDPVVELYKESVDRISDPEADTSGYRDPVVELYKESVDRSLLRENLAKTPEERVLSLMRLQRVAREAREAGKRLHGY